MRATPNQILKLRGGMNYKKTFWMNAVLAVLFLCVILMMFYSGGALQIITAEESYTTLMGFSMFYILAIAPLVAIVTAYSLIKLKHGNQALLLNIAQLLFVIVVALYAYSMPMSMIKKEMRIESSIFFVFYVIPSLINIRALRKNERK
jgi:hypothetical protein